MISEVDPTVANPPTEADFTSQIRKIDQLMSNRTLDDLPQPDLPRLPPRSGSSHKGSFGSALLIGGSRGMTGAIAMAGLSAAKSGAGLVRLAVPDRCLETVAACSPCFMTIPVEDDQAGRIAATGNAFHEWLERSTCTAIGPGMGQSASLQQMLSDLLSLLSYPVVIDADGLNCLAALPQWPQRLPAGSVLTPHPGEWSRLCGIPASELESQRERAVQIAQAHHLVIVLKGQHTLVTDGACATLNSSGTPAMATGGSGDVLTGVITALICQGLPSRDAAQLGVFVHGRAAEIAEQSLQSHVVLPTELIDFLPRGFKAADTVAK